MMNFNKSQIDSKLASYLIAKQFPQWKDLSIKPVKYSGWDNRTFHLGQNMLMRLPSAREYAAQVENEQRWLPKLAPHLPLSIPEPIAMGLPDIKYPFKWSIYKWIEGEPASSVNIIDMNTFAFDLAQFIEHLQKIDTFGGPVSGNHNFHRGGALVVYDVQTKQAIDMLKNEIDGTKAYKIWQAALNTTWLGKPVWVHGDISMGNLLVQGEKLSAVIDFGQLAIGDPACDLAIAWLSFSNESKNIFQEKLPLDKNTWLRGQAWALWKMLLVASGLTQWDVFSKQKSLQIIDNILKERKDIS